MQQQEALPPICRRILAIAERDPRRAAPLARRALAATAPDDLASQAWARYALGFTLLCWERFADARPHLAGARQAFERLAEPDGLLRCRFALLLTDVMQYARPELEEQLAALASECEQAGRSLEAGRCRLYQGVLLNVLGRPRDAERVLEEIAPAFGRSPLDHAKWLRVRGVAAIGQSDYTRASGLLAEAEQGFLALRNRLETAKCWNQQAWAALQQEQLDPALSFYRRAEAVFARLDMPLQRAFSAKNIGLALTRRGHYDLALGDTLRAQRQFEALGRLGEVGECRMHLGNIYWYAGRWEAALGCYIHAEAMFERAGMVGSRLIARRNRTLVYHAQRRYADASALLDALEIEARELGNRGELAAIWHEQAEVLAEQNQIEAAIERYGRARALCVELGAMLSAADCAIEQGELALRLGNVDQAQTEFAFAAPHVGDHPYDYWRNLHGLARCAEARGDRPAALAYYRDALAIVATLRQRLASEAFSSSLYARAARLHADALRLAADSRKADLALAIAEGQRALTFQRLLAQRHDDRAEDRPSHDDLRARIGELLDQTASPERDQALDRALDNYAELLLHARHSNALAEAEMAEGEFDLARLRAALGAAYGDDWTALAYTIGDDALLIGVVTPETVALARAPYDDELRQLIARATQPAYRRYTFRDLAYLQGQADRPWSTLRDLAERLLPEPALARLHPKHRLLIVPAGPLHALPWAALRLEHGWLAETAIVQLAPALSAWPALLARPAAGDAWALLVGCASFGERAPALPAVAAELAIVAERWPGRIERLSDGAATRAALLARAERGELARAGLLHVATHARMLPARGLAAHVKLWDGDLLLPEIGGLRLGGGLVVLSACDGAAADVLAGEEVLSLSWALLAAGAGGVLASLWRLTDADAPRVMAAFYDALRETGDAARALALAQRALIDAERDVDGVAGPACWGSLVLTGQSRF